MPSSILVKDIPEDVYFSLIGEQLRVRKTKKKYINLSQVVIVILKEYFEKKKDK